MGDLFIKIFVSYENRILCILDNETVFLFEKFARI